jgi:hypothetical protein
MTLTFFGATFTRVPELSSEQGSLSGIAPGQLLKKPEFFWPIGLKIEE